MNDAAILGLIADLYAQVALLTAQNNELSEQLAAAPSKPSSEPVYDDGSTQVYKVGEQYVVASVGQWFPGAYPDIESAVASVSENA